MKKLKLFIVIAMFILLIISFGQANFVEALYTPELRDDGTLYVTQDYLYEDWKNIYCVTYGQHVETRIL